MNVRGPLDPGTLAAMKADEFERRLHKLETRVANLVRFLAVAEVPFFDPKPKAAPLPPPRADDPGCEVGPGRAPKPPEPSIRIIKEGHIPPRTDGHVSWWQRLFSREARHER
jgi:hypothetical protein